VNIVCSVTSTDLLCLHIVTTFEHHDTLNLFIDKSNKLTNNSPNNEQSKLNSNCNVKAVER